MATGRRERVEWLAAARDPAYFLDHYGWCYDATAREWIRFVLWPAQAAVLDGILAGRLLCILKARQLGLSWLVVGFALWLMLFRPAATVLLFSKRDDEAVHLLSFRLRGMYRRLPAWMRARAEIKASGHEWRLSNGSAALAFPTTGGRSYTATLAVVDEADFCPDLDALMNAVKPTIDAGGRLVLVSTVDKSRPESAFKRLYWAGTAGSPAGQDGSAGGRPSSGGWRSMFLPWSARPGRDQAWYELQRGDVLARTGFLDDLYQEYPATDLEALAPRTADVRFPAGWLAQCSGGAAHYASLRGDKRKSHGDASQRSGGPFVGDNAQAAADEQAVGGVPTLPGLVVYGEPAAGRSYVIGADPAEGNPQSDESAATVLDRETGEEVAAFAGRCDPAVFAGHLAALSEYFYHAAVLVERNNHGHAVLLALTERGVPRLRGLDGQHGWLTTAKSKALAFDAAADRLMAGDCAIHSPETLRQLQAIQGSTLAAPEGQHDDRAVSFVLALAALRHCRIGTGKSAMIPPVDVIAEADRGGGRGWEEE